MQYELKKYYGRVLGDVRYIENFAIPELGRNRKIWLYLPRGYERSTLHYPVIYMHDGQNIFSPDTAFGGEWEVDDTIERLISEDRTKGAIVVGIESDAYRECELVNTHTDCAKYLQFIVRTLKPYIDSHF